MRKMVCRAGITAVFAAPVLVFLCYQLVATGAASSVRNGFNSIEIGMSEENVQELLGRPPGRLLHEQPGVFRWVGSKGQSSGDFFSDGSYDLEGRKFNLTYRDRATRRVVGKIVIWACEDYEIRVLFGPKGLVVGCELLQFSYSEFSAKDVVRFVLGKFGI
jgi:hypothetical protein